VIFRDVRFERTSVCVAYDHDPLLFFSELDYAALFVDTCPSFISIVFIHFFRDVLCW